MAGKSIEAASSPFRTLVWRRAGTRCRSFCAARRPFLAREGYAAVAVGRVDGDNEGAAKSMRRLGPSSLESKGIVPFHGADPAPSSLAARGCRSHRRPEATTRAAAFKGAVHREMASLPERKTPIRIDMIFLPWCNLEHAKALCTGDGWPPGEDDTGKNRHDFLIPYSNQDSCASILLDGFISCVFIPRLYVQNLQLFVESFDSDINNACLPHQREFPDDTE